MNRGRTRLFCSCTAEALEERNGRSFSAQAVDSDFESALNRLASSSAEARRQDYAASLLRQCGIAKALHKGKRVHACIARIGHGEEERGTFMGNSIVHMYGKCSSVQDARASFERICAKNTFSWTIMIAAYAQNGHYREAIALFRRMDLEGAKPNLVTFVNVIAACTGLRLLHYGARIHQRIFAAGLDESNAVLGTALIDMYGKCGSTDSARRLFERIEHRTIASWNAMIGAYTQNRQGEKALELYRRIKQQDDVEPNVITIVTAIDACSSGNLKALAQGREIHAEIAGTELEKDLVVASALVDMYGKCGSLIDAKLVFDSMPYRNVVSWNSLIAAYAQLGHSHEALALYRRMVSFDEEVFTPTQATFTALLAACSAAHLLDEGKALHAELITRGLDQCKALGTAMVSMYGKCGSLCDARAVFDRMKERDVVCWTALIAAYAQHGLGREAFELYQRMEPEGVKPDQVTFVTVLDACSSSRSLSDGRMVHSRIISSGFFSFSHPDGMIGNALINMYSKCGSFDDARDVFQMLKKEKKTSISSWNAIIGACVENGRLEEAVELYREMDSGPDEITFLHVLSASSELKSMEFGRAVHEQIRLRGLEASTLLGNALINMYSRCSSSISDAREIFDRLPHKDVISWNTMIGGYALHGSCSEAMVLYQKMDLNPTKATFASLLNACSSCSCCLEDLNGIHSAIVAQGLENCEALGSKLITLYGKFGRMQDAVKVFKRLACEEAATWSSIITAHAQHGLGREALELFYEQELQGVQPDETTLVSMLSACSHSGLIETGLCCFSMMLLDHGIQPQPHHWTCLVDLLARAGWLDKAEQVVVTGRIPLEMSYVASMSLLAARSNSQHDQDREAVLAQCAAQVLDADQQQRSSGPYVLLSNLLRTNYQPQG